METTATRPDLSTALGKEDLEAFEKLHELAHKKTDKNRLAIVASKGTLDMAYPPLILATSAAAMGMEVGVYFTFYGMDIINKRKLASLKVAPLANPAAPVPVPNLLGAIPGMTYAATWMMRRMMGKQKMPSIPQMLDMCKQFGVRFFACSTTMGVMGVKAEDVIEGAAIAGAAAFLDFASDAKITMFI